MTPTNTEMSIRAPYKVGAVVALGIVAVILCGCASGGGAPQPSGPSVVLGGEVVFEAARGDQPIQGAQVGVVSGDKTFSEATTDADGRFRISDLPGAPFNLVVTTGDDYQDYDHQRDMGALLDPGAFPNGRKFLAIRVEGHQTALSGKVMTEDDQPVGGASVRTYPVTVNATTNEDGTFDIRSGRFENVEYRVEASRAGFQSKLSDSLRPTIGETNDVGTITLAPYELDKRGTAGGEMEEGGAGTGDVTQGDQ